MFAAGNDGWFTDRDGLCTVNAPALAKNVLAIGATSSGSTRLTITDADGKEAGGTLGDATIDTIAAFSSYGPTQVNREDLKQLGRDKGGDTYRSICSD